MKKILFSFITLILLTGCTAEYNLDFDDDNYMESLNIETTSDHLDYENVKNYEWPKSIDYTITGSSEVPEKIEGVIYYDFENYQDEDKAGFTYSYNMTKDQYKKSAIVHNCFSSISIQKNDKKNIQTLNTSTGFECFTKYPPLEKVTINIKTNKNVVQTNADRQEGNVYTWIINSGNAATKSIMISTSEEMEEEKETNITLILIIIGAFFILLFVLIRAKNKKYRGN